MTTDLELHEHQAALYKNKLFVAAIYHANDMSG